MSTFQIGSRTFTGEPFLRCPSLARDAVALPSPIRVGVLLVVFVALRTVCFGALPSGGGASRWHRPDTTPEIFFVGDWLKVARIHAGRHATQVVYNETRCDRTDVQFIGYAMGESHPRASRPCAYSKYSVAMFVQARHPDPATGFSNDLDVSHESLFDRERRSAWHSTKIPNHGVFGHERAVL